MRLLCLWLARLSGTAATVPRPISSPPPAGLDFAAHPKSPAFIWLIFQRHIVNRDRRMIDDDAFMMLR